jgi:glycerol-3-phosphate O-acyltransferase
MEMKEFTFRAVLIGLVMTGAIPVFLVPLAIVRGGTGYRRRESRVATLLYSVQDTPGEMKRLVSYVWNRGQSQLVSGREIALADVVAEAPGEPDDRLARRLARMLQIHVYREERIVQGPALRSPREVREIILRDPELARLTRRIANERGIPRRQVVAEARGYVKEMAARFNGFYFSILEFVFNWIWPRAMVTGTSFSARVRCCWSGSRICSLAIGLPLLCCTETFGAVTRRRQAATSPSSSTLRSTMAIGRWTWP